MVTQLFGITMPSDQLSTVVSAFTHWRNSLRIQDTFIREGELYFGASMPHPGLYKR
jgi:hypothetical protein